MSKIQGNGIDFAWDEWENEFRGVVGEMTDEEWGNLDNRLTRMEEQEEGIFAEINKHSEMPNDKGKIVEITVVENKTENRPNANDSVEMCIRDRVMIHYILPVTPAASATFCLLTYFTGEHQLFRAINLHRLEC